MAQNLAGYRVNDPVLTKVSQGYAQAESIAPFIAPVVPVTTRAGKIIRFTKEQFAVMDTRRAPGSNIGRVTTNFTTGAYYLNQHALASEIPEEVFQEAKNGAAQLDLRSRAAIRTSETVMLSWENEVVSTITNSSLYETTCTEALLGTSKFSNTASDPEQTVQRWKEAVRTQIGCYPNSAVISTDVYNALKFHPIFRDRVKYTSSGSINLDMLAAWFDLPRGIRIAQKVRLNPTNQLLVDIMPAGTFALFYSPAGPIGDGFLPVEGADKAVPAFGYTYTLSGYPIVTAERFEENRRVYVSDVIVEQSLILAGLGNNGRVGSGFLGTGVV